MGPANIIQNVLQILPNSNNGSLEPFPLGDLLLSTFSGASLPSTSSPQNYAMSSYGSPTLAFPVPGMTISGGAGDMSKGVKWDFYHSFENFNTSVEFTVDTKTASSFGIGIGVQNDITPAGCRAIITQFNCTSGANSGKLYLWCGDGGGSLAATSFDIVAGPSSVLTVTVGHKYRMSLSRVTTTVVTYTAHIEDLTTPATVADITWSEVLSVAAVNFANNTGRFNIVNFGGTQTVTSWSTSSIDVSGKINLFVGDSISHGLFATNLSSRFASLVDSNYWVSAGGGDITQYVVNKLNCIILLNPQKVFLMIGGNDVALSISSATYQANYSTIVSTLKSNGIQVIHLLATPRDGPDMTPLNNFITSTYGGIDLVINTFTPLEGTATELAAAYDSGDGVHPNNAGHALIASTIVSAL